MDLLSANFASLCGVARISNLAASSPSTPFNIIAASRARDVWPHSPLLSIVFVFLIRRKLEKRVKLVCLCKVVVIV